MKKLEENIILVGENSLNYDEFIADLAKLSIKNITDILLESQITLPRKLNVTALRLALNDKIKIAKTLNLSDEELFRLRFYPFFNEFQLQKLFNTLFDDELFTNYRKYLMELIIQNSEYLRLEDNLVNKLLNVPNKFEDFTKYQEALSAVSYDFDGYFDGVKLDDYDENILKSLTSDDIRLLGTKYDIVIPKRLKKEELISYVKEVMEANGKAIPENVDLDSQSIMMVQRFAKKNNIKITADLKKDECLSYLFHQVSKKDVEYKKEVLLNLYLGDSFVFDLSYVLKTEEKAPLPEVAIEEPIIVEEPQVAVIEDSKIEVIEEVKEEVEEVKEVKEETRVEVHEQPQVVVQAAPSIDPKDLVDIITKSVKEIVVDVVKEIVPLFNEPKKVEEPEKTEEQLVEEKVYNYDNFTNQVNPNFDAEMHDYIKKFDCKTINPLYEEIKVENEEFTINDLAEETVVTDQVTETKEPEIDESTLTEEERIALKAERKAQKKQAKIDAKAQKKQAKIDAKNLSKEEKEKQKAMSLEEKALLKEEKKKEKEQIKLEKAEKKAEEKAAAKQAKLDEKARIKEEKEQEKMNKKLEAEQEKIRLKEEKKENKLKLKEEKRLQKEEEKQQKIIAKKEAKEAAKQAHIDAKIKAKEDKKAEKEMRLRNERNRKEMEKVLRNKGDITKIDVDFYNKFMELENFKMNRAAHEDRERAKRNDRNGKIWGLLFYVILLGCLFYVGFGIYLTWFKDAPENPIYQACMDNQFLKFLFEPFVNWFTPILEKIAAPKA